jgi:hypothetical protein
VGRNTNSDTGGKPKPDIGYNTWFNDNRHVEVAACGGDAYAVAISRLFAANINSAVETPAFAESLGRISRQHRRHTMKYWEIIADNLHNTGWSLGWVSAVNREGHDLDC